MQVVLALVLLATLMIPAVAVAQDASVGEDTRLQVETRRRRLIVRPETPVATAIRDAERAASEIAPGPDAGEAGQPPRHAPQLGYGVTSGIQARNLQRALRR